MERIQKVIAAAGICSRRKAEELIKEKKVIVNGEVVTTIGLKVDDNDEIIVDGCVLKKEKKVYLLLNKPINTLCSLKDQKGRKLVIDCIKINERVFPVGRLDYKTTGALILTNDGQFAYRLTHPKFEKKKVYQATLDKTFRFAHKKILEEGIVLDEYRCSPAQVNIITPYIVEITIHEGHNQQVRKMFSKLGYEVVALTRVAIEFLNIDSLKPGKYRHLTSTEIKRLLQD